MKKIILAVSVILVMASCGQNGKPWTEKEREDVRTIVRNHKERTFLRQMEQKDYAVIENCAVGTVEQAYPVVNAFAELTGQVDTVLNVITVCTSDLVGPSFENLSKIFPASKLVEAGVLPKDFTAEQTAAFYQCVASKLKSVYPNTLLFVDDMLKSQSAAGNAIMMMKDCVASMVPAVEPMTKGAPTPKK